MHLASNTFCPFAQYGQQQIKMADMARELALQEREDEMANATGDWEVPDTSFGLGAS